MTLAKSYIQYIADLAPGRQNTNAVLYNIVFGLSCVVNVSVLV